MRLLSDASALREGAGLRFRVMLDGVEWPAFAVRYRGQIYAYLNTCRHQGFELDFGDGRFFDESYDALVCCHHGARYRPDSGECIEGPCLGAQLTVLRLEQREGALWCVGRAART
ncbi:MAG TPA: Rieske 2Fe-2S domain-containing protein [Candidatus Eisenbacteria bacterium]